MAASKECPVCHKKVTVADSTDGKSKVFSWHTDKMGFDCKNSWKKVN